MAVMAEKDFLVAVALRADLTVDDLGEAQRQADRLPDFSVVDEDTRKGYGIADERTLWSFYVKASSEAEARARALQLVSDLFTDVDPHAEVVGVTVTGWQAS
jgi:hypothetical protein